MKRLPFLLLSCLLSACGSDQVLVHEKIVEVPVPYEVEVPVEVEAPIEEAEIWIDSLVQVRAVDGVDILWVIDTSGSMSAFNERLFAGIEHMMNSLPASGWRLVMMSADPNESISEQQFPLVPGDTITDAEDMYTQMLDGPGEAGFDAVHAYIQSNPYAATWMRPDAALLVVFVSDEEDQSVGFATPPDFVTWYTSRRFGNVFLASIVMQEPDTSVCEFEPPANFIGYRYMEATSMLFGTIVDICSDDWSAGVVDATAQIEPYEYIELSRTPIESTIRVFVDGTPTSDWTYDSGSNTVYFTRIPHGGALVEVGYVVQ